MSQVIKTLRLLTQTYTTKYSSLLISLVLFSFLTACNPKGDLIAPATDVDVSASARPDNSVDDSTLTLKSVASFPIGVALNSKLLISNSKANQVYLKEFNSRTLPIFMSVEWAPGKFNFTDADNSVKMAEGQNLRLHGHCLVYHIAAPEWLTKFNGNTADFEKAVKNHIQTIVGRYKGKVTSWDVINEIFDDKGGLRPTSFRTLYSSDATYLTFVKHCFEWAHEADPAAILLYNDYGYETTQPKLQAVLKMVTDFQKNGVPIQGLGTQTHISLNTSEDGIRNSLQQLAATGLKIHMSELDIAVNPKNEANFNFTKEVQTAQRLKYQAVSNLYKKNIPSRLQYGITLWNMSDADSWLVIDKKLREMPTIFDSQYNKKSAFYGLLNGLKN